MMPPTHLDVMTFSVCPECGGTVTRAEDVFEAHIGRRNVSVPGMYDRCQGDCREFYFAPGEMDAVMQVAARTARAEEELLTPEEIRAFRGRIGVSQQQLEEMLNAGRHTVSRWERGTVIQNGATDTLLRLLMQVPEARRHLLTAHDIIPNVVPLIPQAKPVHYDYMATQCPLVPALESLPLPAVEALIEPAPIAQGSTELAA